MFQADEEKPTEWFDPIYSQSNLAGSGVPWAHMQTHPDFQEWLDKNPISGHGKKAIVVGCGMGDDAITLEKLGFQTTAFDVSDAAIALCKKRFPNSKVEFVSADLFQLPADWLHRFDFVLEIYTIQALPPKYETLAVQSISSLAKPSGQLVVIARVSSQERDFAKGPPWLLTPDHIEAFEKEHCQLSQCFKKNNENGSQQYTSTFSKLARHDS